MWTSTEGIRALAGAEAANLRETIRELVDAIREAKLDEELPKGELSIQSEVAKSREVELNGLWATSGISLFESTLLSPFSPVQIRRAGRKKT